MAWRVARSLETLLGQFNTRFPQRSKASDGSIGDAAHSARTSDHNPDSGGVVRARDFTHDPAHGMDIGFLTNELAASRDPRIKYLIANGMILDSRPGNRPWVWTKYSGANAHRHHMHVSVMPGAKGDEAHAWNLPSLGGAPAPAPAPAPPSGDALKRGDKGEPVKRLQRVLAAWYPNLKLAVDGDFGPATEAAVKELQRRSGLVADGIVGDRTRAVLKL